MANYSEKHIADAMQRVELTPPTRAWNNISKDLNKAKRRKRFLFYFLPAIASLLVLSLSYITFYTNDNQPHQKQIAQSAENNNETLHSNYSKNTKTETLDATSKTNSNSALTSNQTKQFFLKPLIQKTQRRNAIDNKNQELGNRSKTPVSKANSNYVANNVTGVDSNNRPVINSIKPLSISFDSPNEQIVPKLLIKMPPSITPLSKWFTGVSYASQFSSTEFLSHTDIPISKVIVQKNLVNQYIEKHQINEQRSQQFGVYGGKSIGHNVDIMVGAFYSKWNGNVDLYLRNTYEVSTTLTKEHVSKETIKEIVDNSQLQNGNKPNFQEIKGIGGKNYIIGGGLDSISKNKPVNREITRTETTITYEEVTIVEHIQFDDTITSDYSYSYLEIPVTLRYSFGHKRLKGFVAGGFSTQLLGKLQVHSKALSQETAQVSNSTFHSAFEQWNAHASAGVSYNLGLKTKLLLNPYAKVGLTDHGLAKRPFSYGLQFSLEYRF